MSPEEAIARLPELAGATVKERLGDGPTATTWKLEVGGADVVLTIDKPLAQALGLDRAAEFSLLTQLRGAAIAPEPIACDARDGLLVVSWIPGLTLAPEDLRLPETLAQVGALLAGLHSLEIRAAEFDLLATLARYARQAVLPDAEALIREAGQLMSGIPAAGRLCLCHHDVHADNLIRRPGGGLSLVDWEYAALGDPAFDLAVLAGEAGLSAAQQECLLQAYVAAGAETLDRRVTDWKPVYSLLRRVWVAAAAEG